MKLRMIMLLVFPAMFGSVDLVCAEKLSVPEARAHIKEAWNKVRTLSATSLQNNAKDVRGAAMSTMYQGTYYLMKKDDRVLIRQDISYSSSLDFNNHDNSASTGGESTMIGDGVYQYSVATGDTGATVKKMNQSPMFCIGGLGAMQVFFDRYEIKLLPDSTLHGQEVFVFEAIARTKRPRRAIVTVGKKYGILLKRVSYDHEGALRSTLSYHDIKVNEDIDPQKFVFVPPVGVPMEDLTK